MIQLLRLAFIIIRIYIVFKVIFILYMVKHDPQNYSINEVIWWSGFLIFDMWLTMNMPNSNKNDDDNDGYLENFRK